MTTWVLIIILHGWSSGLGSTGNAVAMHDFASEESCKKAAVVVEQSFHEDLAWAGNRVQFVLCTPK